MTEKTIQQLDAESLSQVVAHIGERAVTRRELRDAFDRVANKTNWKLPVNAVIEATAADQLLISEAVVFFTGSVPTITRVPNWPHLSLVRADGYYKAVGA